jgi:hypothetical protein
MITIRISLSWADSPPHPALAAGVHRMAEIMPVVLASHGLAMPDDGDPVRPADATDANVLFDATITGLESALAS